MAPEPTKKSDNFTGLPIPGGAGMIVSLVLAAPLIPAAWVIPLAIGVTLMTAGAMVSTLPYPAFKKSGIILPLATIGAIALPLTILGLYSLIPAGIFGLYFMTGPLKNFYEGSDDGIRMELRRKLFHQLTLLYAIGFHVLGHPLAAYAALGWTAVYGILETLRLKTTWGRDIAQRWLGGITRDKEKNRYTGAFYVSLGVTAAIAIFGAHPAIVTAAVLYLAWGDAASALVGRRWGRHAYKVFGEKRTLEGTTAGFLTAIAVGFIVGLSPWAVLIGALAFSVADTLPIPPDDNFWIPLITAAALFAAYAI